jgi:glycine betaine/proline transport system permease protein
MSDISLPAPTLLSRLTPGARAALVTLLVGALCLLMESSTDLLPVWPEAWTLPVTEWVGNSLDWLFDIIRPAMRLISAVLEYPMLWVNWVLVNTPWPLIIGATVALGWYAGGLSLALMSAIGLGFVLASGYWIEGMNTLALVFVSVPLALALGLLIGIWSNESARARPWIEATLDLMQTVPTFAYLTPLLLLFGFGPVVGLIASAIYAAPPMARNTLLGLQRVEAEVKEAGVMSGATRLQQLVQVEIPAAATQIMIGVNQALMAALSMVIIAAVIGGFDDIGWEVLLTMRQANFGQSLLAGLVIVVFAIIIDRISARMATSRDRFDVRISWIILAVAIAASVLAWAALPAPGEMAILAPTVEAVDGALSSFTRSAGSTLDSIKNNAMFYGLLPLRIGLDGAVLPFTWGFSWTANMSYAVFAVAGALGVAVALTGRVAFGLCLPIIAGILETGVSDLPWPFVLVGLGAVAWVAGGWKLTRLVVILMLAIAISGLWPRAMLSLYLCGAAVIACAVLGGALGLLSAVSKPAWAVIRPVCDMLQTIPLFVFLIPVLMFFQIGEFSAFLAIIAYAIVPMIRYTRHGLVTTPPEMLESAVSSGATEWQIMKEVRAPYAAPTILLGLNQTILYAFAMLVIAALIGTTGLGQSIYIALGSGDVGLGISAGAAMAILALIADRIVQGFAEERRRALGL